MRQLVHSSIVALAVVGFSPAVVHAIDWCFNSNGFPFIVQDFAKPGRGACHAVMGHADTDPVTGVACLNSAGTTLRVAYTIHRGDLVEDGSLILPNPALTGGTSTYIQISTSGNTTFVGAASAAICDPTKQPIP